jgi:hypothetical protein
LDGPPSVIQAEVETARTDRRQIVAVDDQRFDAKCFCVKPLPGTATVLRERAYMALGATAADDGGVSASGPAAA